HAPELGAEGRDAADAEKVRHHRPPAHPSRRRRLPPRPPARARPARRGRRGRGSYHGIEVPAATGAYREKWRKFSAPSGTEVAEREGFEPSIRFPVYTRSRRAPSTTRPPLRKATVRLRTGRWR